MYNCTRVRHHRYCCCRSEVGSSLQMSPQHGGLKVGVQQLVLWLREFGEQTSNRRPSWCFRMPITKGPTSVVIKNLCGQSVLLAGGHSDEHDFFSESDNPRKQPTTEMDWLCQSSPAEVWVNQNSLKCNQINIFSMIITYCICIIKEFFFIMNSYISFLFLFF